MTKITSVKVPQSIVDSIYKGSTALVEDVAKLPVNAFVMLTGDKSQVVARHNGKGIIVPLSTYKDVIIQGIKPGDVLQKVLIETFMDDEIKLAVAFGEAGTGKTSLALAYAIDQMMMNNKRIYMCKPTVQVGASNAFGPVPGDVDEKYAPYLTSYKTVFKKLLGERANSWMQIQTSHGNLKYVPIELARGCTFEDSTFILDEAQNLDWHELNTIVSRMGQGTKLIILGDLEQIDVRDKQLNRYLFKEETGLYKLVNSKAFKQSKICSTVELTKQYRSEITQLVADVNKELRNDEQARASIQPGSREPYRSR